MQVQTFKKDEYRDCPVYYRNMRDHFEYLVIINNELYTAHIQVKPFFITRVLHLLGYERTMYSKQHQLSIVKQLRRLTETTVDFVLDKPAKVKDN